MAKWCELEGWRRCLPSPSLSWSASLMASLSALVAECLWLSALTTVSLKSLLLLAVPMGSGWGLLLPQPGFQIRYCYGQFSPYYGLRSRLP